MPDDDQVYLIDTDVLVHIDNRRDSAHIYDGLIKLAGRLKLRTVRQVFGELQRFPSAYSALKEHRETFQILARQQYDSRVSEFIEIIGNKMPLWEQTGAKNPDSADPWLVAVAATYRYTVVTDESDLSPVKIPAACKLPEINCRCISGPHYLIKFGLVTDIRPEHIDPARFFRKE